MMSVTMPDSQPQPAPVHVIHCKLIHTLCAGLGVRLQSYQTSLRYSRKYTQTHSTSVTHSICSRVGRSDLLPHGNGMTQLGASLDPKDLVMNPSRWLSRMR